MDESRRFIANKTSRGEDLIEKTDTALVGLSIHLLNNENQEKVVVLTTDKPAGLAAETILEKHGYKNQIKYQYISEEYLQKITADKFP